MQNAIKTQRTYYIGAALLALIAAVLRTLSLTLTFDRASGYFTASALPLLFRAFWGCSLIALVLFPILALKGRIPSKRAALSPFSTCGACLCALLLFLNFVCSCTMQPTGLPIMLWIIGLLAILFGIVYFILQTPFLKAGATTHAVFGSLTILAFACLIAFTYFDIGTPMNAPHKTDLHMALLAVMLYLLYELRAKADISRPLALTACGAVAFFLTATVGLSDVVAYLAGAFTDPVYFAQDLLLLALAIYIGARSMADAALSNKN
ncbi:MAG: hypothetical protein E7636_05050 [Ruminococcaceae bacterium]|nr:hypothetical protein [Oscillospiraceae bacterium]